MPHHWDALAGQQGSHHELANIFGQRCDGGENQSRRSTEENGNGKRLVELLGNGVVKSAALANLPVHARRPGIVPLQAVHAKIVALVLGMFGIHQGQRNEWATVLLPGGKNRQAVQVGRLIDYLQHRPLLDVGCP